MKQVEKMCRTLRQQAHETGKFYSMNQVALGTITAGKSLQIDGFPFSIPVGNYYVCRTLCQSESQWTEVLPVDNSGWVKLPDKLKPLAVGDRVLVVMPSNGAGNPSDYIVVDVVES
ncbi:MULTISPECIES: hypothetical protein [Caproicibacterium]|uniref:DUF2577 domain-containing protein n=1 Tax=Caproicibacterium argilliputei TaxID=3030016 RepID=A0AA97DDL0_9FIRM|nr:hypothetical protein [Caproicibacterium argilliputei]WOC33486.1 hypothetical protein PXC00_06360 [Caproicibacterium argilliputei]